MPGVVEGLDWSMDRRWLAIGTRKGTVRVFPINPYGSKMDIASHLEIICWREEWIRGSSGWGACGQGKCSCTLAFAERDGLGRT